MSKPKDYRPIIGQTLTKAIDLLIADPDAAILGSRSATIIVKQDGKMLHGAANIDFGTWGMKPGEHTGLLQTIKDFLTNAHYIIRVSLPAGVNLNTFDVLSGNGAFPIMLIDYVDGDAQDRGYFIGLEERLGSMIEEAAFQYSLVTGHIGLIEPE